jgi:tetratricopeptide (TPR) repeat protein
MSIANSSILQAMDAAGAHLRSGKIAEAEALYRRIVALHPETAEAWSMLGGIAHQCGRYDAAAEFIGKAAALAPGIAAYHSNLGEALRALNRHEEAIASYRRALAIDPGLAATWSNLGAAFSGKGMLAEAIASYEKALAINPRNFAALNNLGRALQDQGRLKEATARYWQALAIQPDFAVAYSNLGTALAGVGMLEEAVGIHERAVALQPGLAAAHYNLAAALELKGRHDDASASYRRALALNPGYAEAHNNLGNILKAQGRLEEAIGGYRQAAAIKPAEAQFHNNLGCGLHAAGNFAEAMAAYRRAIALQPDFAEAHANLAYTLLLLGDFAQGWIEYEWRWKTKEYAGAGVLEKTRWDGRDLGGRTILLHADQGFGDTIHFMRYVPEVLRRNGRVVVECQRELHRLLRKTPGVQEWIVPGDALPAFDVRCPLPSLPLVLGTRLETIPVQAPLLLADERAAMAWESRLSGSGGVKVGLAWAGNPAFKNDRSRSVRELALLAPLTEAAGVHFYSLQKGEAGRQAKAPPAGMRLSDFTDELADFADTAALVANLDLVITSDTAMAHLAGAMGKAVWVMLDFVPDWRWLVGRTDSPWYPTMRLFRQTAPGDWNSVARRVAGALAAFSAEMGRKGK